MNVTVIMSRSVVAGSRPPYAGGVTGTCIYDGDCGFCTRSAQWLERHGDCAITPWQALDLAALGLTEEQVSAAVQWQDASGSVTASGADAIARALLTCGRPWRWIGRALTWRVVRPFAAIGYRLVARYRYRLPGATDACRI